MPAKSRDHPKGILRGRQWIYLGDHDRVAYVEFTRDWKGIHPRTVLKGYKGDVQGDGYAGIDVLFRNFQTTNLPVVRLMSDVDKPGFEPDSAA